MARSKSITKFEYENLKIGDSLSEGTFDVRHFELLKGFHGDRDSFKFYSLTHRGIKFAQYVGIICVGDLQIEILPKADKYTEEGEQTWRERLLEMLRVVYKLKIHSTSNANQYLSPNKILDVFLSRFLDEVERILHIGLVKTYRKVQENTTALKGKLVISKHITKNLIHKERFFVEHNVYDYNHICNVILYKTLRTILDITRNSAILSRAHSLMFLFPELNDIHIDENTFNKIRFERRTEEYRSAIQIAKLILLGYMPSINKSHQDNVLALMFDMNKLWEEYVYRILNRTLRKKDPKYEVYDQKIKTFWNGEYGEKTIRPDITVSYEGKCLAVLDTKWKCPKENKPSDADLKQMYVYHLFWNTNNTALLYPGNKDTIKGTFELTNRIKDFFYCNMLFLQFKDKQLDINVLVDFFEDEVKRM